MTVSTEDFRWTYTSTGGVTYQYLNKILTQDDLTVYASSVLQTIGTDYTVDGVGDDAGGNVTFLAAPAAGTTILITKDGIAFTQDHDYTENDPFPAASHEDALDKQTNLAQKIWDYVRRSVKVAITSTLTDLELPSPSAGKYLGWNDTGTGLSNLTPIALGSISDDTYSSAGWDGASEVAPSKNAVRDKIELMIADIDTLESNVASLVSDTAYSSTSWDGATEVAPSKNAVRDILQKGITGQVVQVVNYQTGSYATGTGQIISDDTIPLQTEGDEYMQLAITPKSASNYLKIEVTGMWSDSINSNIGVALFQDSIATGLAAVNSWIGLPKY
ncbi:MAG: hypothetical protein WC332_07325, partial [Clostridia bacterium]